ncbi:O(6)-methylguanine-induced apoptosis 2-like [Rhopilema esculentum]|uniref:O(6)-methylguanine-induced apoptosis 2-like n=1 Tax=Rhopilema esculentum TaxID=499914 RepID=UPI0031DFB653
MSQSVLQSVKSGSQVDRRSKLFNLQHSTGRPFRSQRHIAPSIPSKYQTIVNSNSESKGFGSKARRFNDDQNLPEGPAPSHYRPVSEATKESTSFSKKGTGSFASKSKRFQRSKNNLIAVAPGQYNPVYQASSDFNKASCTSNFHLPIAVNKDDQQHKFSTPAPNKYVISNKVTGRIARENNVAALAAFKSRSRRDLLNFKVMKANPAPGAYNVDDAITKANPRHATAPFKSTTERGMLQNINSYPGPGSYRPFEPQAIPDRKRLPRQHYLCISAPAMPLPPSPPLPGPGHYNLVNYEGEPRRYVTSSVFVSTTNRLMGQELQDNESEPGPATYNPQSIGKQSFIYNVESKWI